MQGLILARPSAIMCGMTQACAAPGAVSAPAWLAHSPFILPPNPQHRAPCMTPPSPSPPPPAPNSYRQQGRAGQAVVRAVGQVHRHAARPPCDGDADGLGTQRTLAAQRQPRRQLSAVGAAHASRAGRVPGSRQGRRVGGLAPRARGSVLRGVKRGHALVLARRPPRPAPGMQGRERGRRGLRAERGGGEPTTARRGGP